MHQNGVLGFWGFGSLGPAGWIASGVLVFAAGIGYVFIKSYLNKQANQAAGQESERQKKDLESSIPVDNSKQTISDDEDAIRNIVKP